MNQTFIQKFLMQVFFGFAAACVLWVYNHFIVAAIRETSNAGYSEMYKTPPRR